MTTPTSWTPFLHRRDLLKVGALSVAGTLLPFRAHADSQPRVESVIVMMMMGGVTHHDSFDPKPDAAQEIRGTLTAIDTVVPGIRFCETMPCLAQEAHRFAVVRSFVTDNNDHFESQAYALSGRKVNAQQITTEPNVGAIVAKLQGAKNGFPGYIAIPGTTRPGPPPKNLFVGGWLGQEYAPFATGGRARNEDFTASVSEAPEEQFQQQAVQFTAGLNAERLMNRQSLREQLDTTLDRIDRTGLTNAVDRQFQSGFEMLLKPSVRQAFDLAREPDKVRDRYGRTKIGQRCLMARRLSEAGAPFVLVDYGYDPDFGNLWDNHNAPVQKHPVICDIVKKPYHLAGTDRACAALLNDLADRGRLDSTLVVFLTEFGRTPKINANGGRDHWGAAGSIWFAGAGIRGGQVIGATDKIGGQTVGPRYTPGDVAATMYRALGIDLATMLVDKTNRPLAMLPDGEPIAPLWS